MLKLLKGIGGSSRCIRKTNAHNIGEPYSSARCFSAHHRGLPKTSGWLPMGSPLLSRATVPTQYAKQQPWSLISVKHYAKRRRNPHDVVAWIKVKDGEPCPPSQPNEGSVKNRKQKKRMDQRHAFRKAEVQKSIALCRAAQARKLEKRRQRWKEATARVKAWKAKKAAEAKAAEASQTEELVPVA